MTTASNLLLGVLCLAWAILLPKTAASKTVACSGSNTWNGIVDTDITFSGGCTFYGTVTIAASNVTLDCAGGVIDGSHVEQYGIVAAEPADTYSIQGRTCGEAAPLRTGIRIQNCTIRNQVESASGYGGQGIQLRRKFREVPKATGSGCTRSYAHSAYGSIHEVYRAVGLDASSAAQARPSSDDDVTAAIRDLSIGDIGISQVTIENVEGVGLYIWEFSHDYDVFDLEVVNARIGVYIDSASRDNVIESSAFEDNEATGIVIDGAEANTVRTSRFAGHHGASPAVGIRLYKNCGERMIRRMGHSKRNLLTKNEFVDNDIGIWVGSRQGLPRSASAPFDCRFDSVARDGEVARPSWVDLNYDKITLDAEQCVAPRMLGADKITRARDDYGQRHGTRQNISWFRDYAYGNDIIGNTFHGHKQAGVVVWDDDTAVVDNHFGGVQRLDVCVGNQFREVIGEPLEGVIVEGNVSLGHGSPVHPPIVTVHGARMSQRANVDASMTTFMLLD